jgi:hypothetical protein
MHDVTKGPSDLELTGANEPSAVRQVADGSSGPADREHAAARRTPRGRPGPRLLDAGMVAQLLLLR